MSTKTRLITIEEALTHPNKVRAAQMKEDAATELGYGTGAVTVYAGDGGTRDFSSGGVDPNGAGSVRQDWTTAEETALGLEGTLSFMLSTDSLGFTTLASDPAYLAGWGTGWFELNPNAGQMYMNFAWASGNTHPATRFTPYERDAYAEVTLRWTNFDDMEFWFDGLHITTYVSRADYGNMFTGGWSVSGLTSLSSDYEGARVKDFYALDTQLDTTPTESVLFLGNSYVVQGSPVAMFTHDDVNFNRPSWLPSNGSGGFAGFDGDDLAEDYGSMVDDSGLVTGVIRQLHKAGIFTGNNKNYARSGSTGSQISAKHTEAIAGGYVPTTVVAVLGANVLAGGRTIADEKADLQTWITEVYDNGSDRILLAGGNTIQADSQYSTPAILQKELDYGVMLSELSAWSVAQGYGSEFLKTVNLYGLMGGATPDPSEWQWAGEINGAAIVSGGTGYTANDQLLVTEGGGTGGIIVVDTVDGSGVITAVKVFSRTGSAPDVSVSGTDYQSLTTFTSSPSEGTGTGASFTISTGNLHPSEAGQAKIGKFIGAAAVLSVQGVAGGTGTSEIISHNIIS